MIEVLKKIFARHKIPDELVSNNGPQYSAYAFRQFSSSCGFRHTTSSPKFPQSNSESERAVQTIKSMLRKAKVGGIHSALLAYRATSSQSGLVFSPAELLTHRTPDVWKLAQPPNAGTRYIRGWRTIYSYFISNANR